MQKGGIGRTALIVLVLALGIGVAVVFKMTGPRPKKQTKPDHAVLVEVMTARPEKRTARVEATGTVLPAKTVDIIPQVSGEIVEINPQLVPGGYLEEGDLVVRVDDRDYKAAKSQAWARVEEARAALKIEEGRQTVAEREWEIMKDLETAPYTKPDLALRKPQLRQARARLNSAMAAYNQARLNLERTRITAPWNAWVRSESAEVGQLVGPQSRVANLVGADKYWVRVSVPESDLPMIGLPDSQGNGGARAAVVRKVSETESVEREGRVVRVLGDLDTAGRMARLLIEIDDPLGAAGTTGNGQIPLMLDAYVRARIEGRELEGIYVIGRTTLRENSRVWILTDEDTLEFRDVTVAWKQGDEIFISGGLDPGEKIVTSRIPTPLPGMKLRAEGLLDAGGPGNPGGAPSENPAGNPSGKGDDK